MREVRWLPEYRGDHWFVCDTDFTKWYAGYNLFSCWQDETEDTWRENAAKLAGYIEVKPLHADHGGEP